MNHPSNSQSPEATPRSTALYDFHLAHGGKMVDFANYLLPVQYARGVMAEHLHCRDKAGLFDVSHMGQAWLRAKDGEDTATLFEELVPGGVSSLRDLQTRYTLLTDKNGGIRDDLMVTRRGQDLWLVVNAACKIADFAHISETLEGRAHLEIVDCALLALQGPSAVRVLANIIAGIEDLAFMSARAVTWQGREIFVTRCGYTGEDGFEISLPNEIASAFAQTLMANEEVGLCGLGARDSLRLEAGLCLYGHDIDHSTTPAEADLMWTIPNRRRLAADFPGSQSVLAEAPKRLRVGIRPDGRAPAREGTPIHDKQGQEIGVVTSGGFSPSLSAPIAMGYVSAEYAPADTEIDLIIRGKAQAARVVQLPFVPHRYHTA